VFAAEVNVKWIVPAILIVSFSFSFAADKEEKPKPAQSIPELQQQLEKILKDTHTPGVSVAIVHKDRAEWIAGLGIADVGSGRANTADTLFRIGSTSKAFASLSILLLKNQGKVTLDDSVHKLVPDLSFENRWESTDPIRVVNLLEHTTGWDDMHLREYAKQAPDSMSLFQGLDYDHTSRVSRWRPGTRAAYCNSGPPAAAYIVERLTGQRFEDFVQQNLFLPIGMKTATYFEPPAGTATTLYHGDGKTPYPYWHILLRPAGSINASANDMAAYVQFYLNRGSVKGKQVVPSSDIDRMEVAESTWAAKEGLKAGYGLSNYWSIADGFVYHGHDGGVEGGITNLAYMPDYDVGYFFSINSASGDAFEKIGKAIRAYITNKLQKPAVPPVASLPPDAADYAGWYEPNSPRVELGHFIERLTGLTWMRVRDGHLTLVSLGGQETFVPVAGRQFRHLPKQDPPDPVASFALLTTNQEGRFVQLEAMSTLKKIPAWYAMLEILLTAYVLLSLVAVIGYAPFWILGGLSKRRRRPAERAMRWFPLLAVLCLLVFVGIFILCSDDLISRMGNHTFWSEALRVTTLAYAVAVLLSAYAWLRAPKENVRRGVRLFSRIVTLALLILAAYLGYWGIINLRTWT
jgi:CubicO group peptidase (beta-lactamase class C family)